MNAVWIAFIAVFAALIPVFVFAAKQFQMKKAEAAGNGRNDGGSELGYIPVADGGAHKSVHHDHAPDSGSDSGGGDGGGGDGGGGGD